MRDTLYFCHLEKRNEFLNLHYLKQNYNQTPFTHLLYCFAETEMMGMAAKRSGRQRDRWMDRQTDGQTDGPT